MSFQIGSRIEKLREERGITLDQMGELLGTTRQRYRRMEKGQIDLSFITIKKIADYFGVSTMAITSAVEESRGLTALFREKADCPEAVEAVACIEKILRVFHSHERLYYQMKREDPI